MTATKSALFVALNLLKGLLNEKVVNEYLWKCDERWLVPGYDVEVKTKQINMENKLNNLPKNSVFYRDFYQLMEEKLTLNLIQDLNKIT